MKFVVKYLGSKLPQGNISQDIMAESLTKDDTMTMEEAYNFFTTLSHMSVTEFKEKVINKFPNHFFQKEIFR